MVLSSTNSELTPLLAKKTQNFGERERPYNVSRRKEDGAAPGTPFGAPPQILMNIGTSILEVFVSRKVKTASAQIK